MRVERSGVVTFLLCVAAAVLIVPIVDAAGPDMVTASDTVTLNATYACSGSGIIGPGGASPVGPIANQTTSVAITLPATAEANVPFSVGVDVGNLTLSAAPSFLNLNAAGIVAAVSVTGTGSVLVPIAPNIIGNAVIPADNFVGNGASLDLKPGTVPTTATANGPVTFSVTKIAILSGSTGFVCEVVGAPASRTFTVGPPPTTTTTTTTTSTTTTTQPTTTTTSTTSTTVAPTTSTTSTTVAPTTSTTSTTVAPTTSTTVAPTTSTTSTTVAPTTSTTVAPTTSTTTTVAPTSSTTTSSVPTGGTAKPVVATRTVNYSCRLVDPGPPEKPFGSGNAPDSVVTAIITAQDIVGVGGTFGVQVKLDPGPSNGPIALAPGTLNYKVAVALTGATVPSLTMSGGPNTVLLAANAKPVVPDVGTLAGEVTAAAAAGGTVDIALGQIDLIGLVGGITVDTRCIPAPKAGESADKVISVAVVAGSVDNSSIPTTTTTTTTVKSATFASCAAAKAAGRGVIPRSSPAYSVALDADKDGLACEANEGSASGSSAQKSAVLAASTGASLALTGSSSFLLGGFGILILVGGVALSLLAVHLDRSRSRPPAWAQDPDR